MNLALEDFINGAREAIYKAASPAIFGNIDGSSIVSNIDSQTNWTFNTHNNKLHLNTGSNVHSFDLSGDVDSEEDFPVSKLPDITHFDFGKHGDTGTAQVHRANPGTIYVTLHDGKTNPTFTLRHEFDTMWRFCPKAKKEAAEIPADELDSFIKAAVENFALGLLDQGLKGMDSAGKATLNGTMSLGLDPAKSAILGAAAGGLYDIGKRTLYNTPEENKEEGIGTTLRRMAIPGLLLGGIGLGTSNLFSNYYNQYPSYKA